MELTQDSASRLCRRVIEHLETWRVLPAILQVGGIETRASSKILGAIEQWLSDDEQRSDLIVIPEYRLSKTPPPDESTDSKLQVAAEQLACLLIDYALVKDSSVGKASLEVATVLEVKTNYLCQSDLKKRPLSACQQARRYGERCSAPAYVLYIVASPIGLAPAEPRDAGWRYFRTVRPSLGGGGPLNESGMQILGQHSSGPIGIQGGRDQNGTELWACLLGCDLPNQATSSSPEF